MPGNGGGGVVNPKRAMIELWHGAAAEPLPPLLEEPGRDSTPPCPPGALSSPTPPLDSKEDGGLWPFNDDDAAAAPTGPPPPPSVPAAPAPPTPPK